MKFELTNDQRLYLGLEPIKPEWEKIVLKGDTYREESLLYFEGDTIKRHIVSTETQYKESQYDDLTRSRNVLLPVTNKGKEKKLTASVLESRQPTGVYCIIEVSGRICISNYNTQTTFYDSLWEQRPQLITKSLKEWVEDFIATSEGNYLTDINAFKKGKRENIKFKPGDFFAFKINRTDYGFGRILLDLDDLKKKNLIPKFHGLGFLMAKPVLIKIYAYASKNKQPNIDELERMAALPSDYIMDNRFYYGEFEIIGNKNLKENDLDFPMSYGRHISASKYCIFLQWGLIHLELPATTSNKYLVTDNPFVKEDSTSRKISNPYGYYGIGFRPNYDAIDIKNTIDNNGIYDFQFNPKFKSNFDLRNPKNKEIRNELMKIFGLDALKSYDENCELTKTINSQKLLKIIS